MATTIPGGRYRRPDGTIVNAHGQVIGEAQAPAAEPAPQAPEAPNKRWNKAQLTEYAAERGIDITAASTNAEILQAIEAAAAAPADPSGDAEIKDEENPAGGDEPPAGSDSGDAGDESGDQQ